LHVPRRQWDPPPTTKKQFLDALKQEQHFIQFLRPGLCERLFSIEPVANDTGTSSFYVSTAGMLKFPVPPGEHTFRVVVASDIDGEYGHDSGIAKFAFLVRSNYFIFLLFYVLTRYFSWTHQAHQRVHSLAPKRDCSQFLSGLGFPNLFKANLATICNKQ
jgi:hypothetical protein